MKFTAEQTKAMFGDLISETIQSTVAAMKEEATTKGEAASEPVEGAPLNAEIIKHIGEAVIEAIDTKSKGIVVKRPSIFPKEAGEGGTDRIELPFDTKATREPSRKDASRIFMACIAMPGMDHSSRLHYAKSYVEKLGFGDYTPALVDYVVAAIDASFVKAMSEGADSAGGYLVPDDFRAEVIQRLPELSELFPYVRVLPTNSDAGKIPNLATDVSVSWDEAENADFDESQPVMGQTTYTIRRMNAICKTSRELRGDSAISLTSYLTELFSEAVAAERDKVIATGNGTDRPQGIENATITNTEAISGALTYAGVVGIKYALSKKYHKGARWLLNATNMERIRALISTTGAPIFNQDPSGAGKDTILGHPISQQDDLPDSTIYFGDLRYYVWFDRERMGTETTIVGGDSFEKHQMWLKVWERVDGKVVLAEAFAKGTGISS